MDTAKRRLGRLGAALALVLVAGAANAQDSGWFDFSNMSFPSIPYTWWFGWGTPPPPGTGGSGGGSPYTPPPPPPPAPTHGTVGCEFVSAGEGHETFTVTYQITTNHSFSRYDYSLQATVSGTNYSGYPTSASLFPKYVSGPDAFGFVTFKCPLAAPGILIPCEDSVHVNLHLRRSSANATSDDDVVISNSVLDWKFQ